MPRGLIAFLTVLVAQACDTAPGGADAREVRDAVIRAPLGGRDVAVGFMRLKTARADRLTGASSPAASAIELHTHEHSGGRMRMRRLETIELPGNKWVTFRSGGLHLMLFGVRDLAPGTAVPVTLRFASGATREVMFSIVDGGAATHEDRHR